MNNILLQKLLAAFKVLTDSFKKKSLSDLARLELGNDFTDDDVCPDDVSCAYAVSSLVQDYLNARGVRFPLVFGTDLLDETLNNSPYFRKIVGIIPEGVPLPANTVIVSPRTAAVHGHTGITDNDGQIMNNNSESGLWVKNYDRTSWRDKFVIERGLVTRLYQVII